MAEAFCNIYRLYEEDDFAQTVQYFQERHIILANPKTECVTRISENGERVETFQAEIAQLIQAHKGQVCFQWWLTPATDIFCCFRWLDDVLLEKYWLDGLDLVQMNQVVPVFVDRFKKLANSGDAFAIILDKRGYSEEYDWDAFVFDPNDNLEGADKKIQAYLPDIIGVGIEKGLWIETNLNGWRKEKFSEEYLLFYKRQTTA